MIFAGTSSDAESESTTSYRPPSDFNEYSDDDVDRRYISDLELDYSTDRNALESLMVSQAASNPLHFDSLELDSNDVEELDPESHSNIGVSHVKTQFRRLSLPKFRSLIDDIIRGQLSPLKLIHQPF